MFDQQNKRLMSRHPVERILMNVLGCCNLMLTILCPNHFIAVRHLQDQIAIISCCLTATSNKQQQCGTSFALYVKPFQKKIFSIFRSSGGKIVLPIKYRIVLVFKKMVNDVRIQIKAVKQTLRLSKINQNVQGCPYFCIAID